MPLLAVRGADSSLAWRAGRWEISRAGSVVRSLRAREVEEIQLLGAVALTASARAAAMARGVPVVFLTADGRFRGRLSGPRDLRGGIVLAQATYLEDPERRLEVARSIVAGKIASQRAMLRVLGRRSLANASAVRGRLDAITAQVPTAGRETLLGLEGESSKLWFSAFGALLRNPELPWNGRSRRPPRDGVNACLSFLYTLLASRVEDAARRVGLLPDLGALHEPGSGRAALVFDLVEEFRAPLVDRLVLRLINLRQLSPEDFEDPAWSRPTFAAGQPVRASGAVYLGELGRRLVLTSWGALLRSDVTDATDGSRVAVDWLLERQARRMARVFQGRDDAYRPWLPA